MRKFLVALFALSILSAGAMTAAPCLAAGGDVRSGVLTYLGTTEEAFQQGLDDLRKALSPLFPSDEELTEEEMDETDVLMGFLRAMVKERRVFRFYDALLAMQMDLRAGRLDEAILPESVGLYLINRNPRYEIKFSLNMLPSSISFGFRKGDAALQKEFNAAIAAMKKDGTLARLEKQYVSDLGLDEPAPVKFHDFKDAPTLKVAVTGDMPPIDLIAADGRPAGYNTAVMAEIGRRLKRNVQLVSVDAGGRSAALVSQRADVVFWYRSTEGIATPKRLKDNPTKGVMRDAAEGVLLSDPYYEWDTDLVIDQAQD